jgi:UDP-glucuronate decarboxylase
MEMLLKSDIEEIYGTLSTSLKKMKDKELLITGAGGFLGRYFLALFKFHNELNPKSPIRIVAIDSHITSTSNSQDPSIKSDTNIEWIFGDAGIGADLPNQFDYIIHAAGIASPEYYRANPLQTLDVAVIVTRKLLEKARIDNSRFLYFSSSEIYGDPFPEFVPTSEDYRGNVSTLGPRACYDESKRLGETLCWIYQNYFSVHACIARPFNVYGPGMLPKDYRVLPNFATSIVKNEKLKVYGHGDQTRTFCYITDAIIGFMKILLDTKIPDVFNVGNPNPEISMKQLANLVNSISKKPATSMELISYPPSYPEDEPNRRCPNISKISETLAFSPQVSLEAGLNRFLTWASKNYTDDLF